MDRKETTDRDNMQIRSERVRRILGTRPPALLRHGTTIVILVLAVIALLLLTLTPLSHLLDP